MADRLTPFPFSASPALSGDPLYENYENGEGPDALACEKLRGHFCFARSRLLVNQ
jgi:hypothetical protein